MILCWSKLLWASFHFSRIAISQTRDLAYPIIKAKTETECLVNRSAKLDECVISLRVAVIIIGGKYNLFA